MISRPKARRGSTPALRPQPSRDVAPAGDAAHWYAAGDRHTRLAAPCARCRLCRTGRRPAAAKYGDDAKPLVPAQTTGRRLLKMDHTVVQTQRYGQQRGPAMEHGCATHAAWRWPLTDYPWR